MKLLEKNKGITLVALVVTIIVLIILAGVSISLVLGQDGVVQKAKAGRDNYAEAARLENEQLANVDAFSIGIGDTIEPKADGMITNMTGGDLDISATVSLTSQGRTEIDFENTKYVFKTSSDPLGVTDSSLYSDGTITEANTTIKKAKSAGTYYLHVLLAEKNGNKQEIISETGATSAGKKDFNYTGSAQNITLIPGNYKLEVWGAEGGGVSYTSYYTGGKGGYSVGTLNVNLDKTLYVYVGGKPTTYNTGGFNGGGNCTNGDGTYSNPGGGASDIRIDSDSLYARLIVAGGGGGASNGGTGSSYRATGGVGGGTSGGTGSSSSYSAGRLGAGGTQTSGGAYGYWSGNSNNGNSGTFGQGGTTTYNCYAAGGGGGWYGGGSGNYCSAGGGSGWIFTESTYNTWRSGNSTDANQYLLKDHPEYYLTNAQTAAGNTSFTAPGGSSETGHAGNGYVRITSID